MVKLTTKDELAVLNAISKVNYWVDLGEHLGMEFYVLEEIRMDEIKFGLGHQRSTMVHKWLSSDLEASWNKLCDALDAMGERAAAEEIREKHILPFVSISPEELARLGDPRHEYKAATRSVEERRVSELEANASEVENFFEAEFKRTREQHQLEIEQHQLEIERVTALHESQKMEYQSQLAMHELANMKHDLANMKLPPAG